MQRAVRRPPGRQRQLRRVRQRLRRRHLLQRRHLRLGLRRRPGVVRRPVRRPPKRRRQLRQLRPTRAATARAAPMGSARPVCARRPDVVRRPVCGLRRTTATTAARAATRVARSSCCSAGVCASVCGPGRTYCGGLCYDMQKDPSNCGAADMRAPRQHLQRRSVHPLHRPGRGEDDLREPLRQPEYRPVQLRRLRDQLQRGMPVGVQGSLQQRSVVPVRGWNSGAATAVGHPAAHPTCLSEPRSVAGTGRRSLSQPGPHVADSWGLPQLAPCRRVRSPACARLPARRGRRDE